MAFKLPLTLVAVITSIALRAIAVPTKYAVGDEKGWDLGVNYTAWAESKEFRVGDTLVFKYSSGKHNVIQVNGTEFKECNVSRTATVLTSGNDEITLKAAGKTWYVCGKGNHCNLGLKLVVTIFPNITVEPASSLSNKITSKYQLLMAVVAAMMML